MTLAPIFLSEVIDGLHKFLRDGRAVLNLDELSMHGRRSISAAGVACVSYLEPHWTAKYDIVNVKCTCGTWVVFYIGADDCRSCLNHDIDPTGDQTCENCLDPIPCHICAHGPGNTDRDVGKCESCGSREWRNFLSIWVEPADEQPETKVQP